MILESVCVGAFQVNCYILASVNGSSAIIIDPGAEEQKIKKILAKYKLKPAFIINTHGHIDHIGCDDKFDIPVYIHEKDSIFLKDPELNLSNFLTSSFRIASKIHTLKDKERIELDSLELEVIHMPGHTPGGIALLLKKPENNILFTGDSLFCQGIGRTDLAQADETLLISSIREKLFILPDETIVYPGHGPFSTIGEEKKTNPFFT